MYDDPHEGVEDNIEDIQHTMLVEGLWKWLSVHSEAADVCVDRNIHDNRNWKPNGQSSP